MMFVRSLLLLSAGALVALRGQSAEDWQTAPGGKMSFDVASVKVSKAPRLPNFPLDNRNAYVRGGRLYAGFTLWTYIRFAYKFPLNQEESRAAVAASPKWFSTDFFEIEARAGGNATKDQTRLMMQSLLADRFKLAVHFETREVPVFALTLVKPGKLGPKLRPHAEGPPCPDSYVAATPGAPSNAAHIFPATCHAASMSERNGVRMVGSRNTTMGSLADAVYGYGGIGRRGG